jgi:DNA-binding CsgD family transcriptional regulator
MSPSIQATEPLLTPREGEVLSLLREHRSNAQIALALGIGVETVRSHARHIYRKLGVSSRRTLLAVA